MRKSRHGTNRRDSADDRLNIIFFLLRWESENKPLLAAYIVVKWKWENIELISNWEFQSAANPQQQLTKKAHRFDVHVDKAASKQSPNPNKMQLSIETDSTSSTTSEQLSSIELQ